MAASHKTIMPSAAGRVCAEAARLQREGRHQQQQQNVGQAPQGRWRNNNNQRNQQQQFGAYMQQQPMMQQQMMPQQQQMAPPPGLIQQYSGGQLPNYGQQWGM